jgi:hypothetical protein
MLIIITKDIYKMPTMRMCETITDAKKYLDEIAADVDPRVPTTDAPEMTVGDSSPIKNENLNKTGGAWYCWKCQRIHRGDEELTC